MKLPSFGPFKRQAAGGDAPAVSDVATDAQLKKPAFGFGGFWKKAAAEPVSGSAVVARAAGEPPGAVQHAPSGFAGMFAMDPDDVFAYETPKVVRLRDRRLGLAQLCIQVVILAYIVVYQVLINKGYLAHVVPTGTVITTTRTASGPQGAECPGAGSHDAALVCVSWTAADVVWPQGEQSALFVTTRASVRVNAPPSAAACSADPLCLGPASDVRRTVVTAGVGAITVRVSHAALAFGSSVASTAANKAVVGGVSFVPRLTDDRSVQSAAAGVHPYGIPSGDIIRVDRLLAEAGAPSLDDPVVPGTQCAGAEADCVSPCRWTGDACVPESLRYTGGVVVVKVHWNWRDDGPGSSYEYRAEWVPGVRLSTSQIIQRANQTMTVARHGIRVLFLVTGDASRFELQQLLVTLASAVSLFAVSNLVVEKVVMRITSRKHVYEQYKYQASADLDDVGDNITKEDPYGGLEAVDFVFGLKLDRLPGGPHVKEVLSVDAEDEGDERNADAAGGEAGAAQAGGSKEPAADSAAGVDTAPAPKPAKRKKAKRAKGDAGPCKGCAGLQARMGVLDRQVAALLARSHLGTGTGGGGGGADDGAGDVSFSGDASVFAYSQSADEFFPCGRGCVRVLATPQGRVWMGGGGSTVLAMPLDKCGALKPHGRSANTWVWTGHSSVTGCEETTVAVFDDPGAAADFAAAFEANGGEKRPADAGADVPPAALPRQAAASSPAAAGDAPAASVGADAAAGAGAPAAPEGADGGWQAAGGPFGGAAAAVAQKGAKVGGRQPGSAPGAALPDVAAQRAAANLPGAANQLGGGLPAGLPAAADQLGAGVPAGGLPTGAAPNQLSSALPTGGLPTGGLPTGAAADQLPTGGLPAAAERLPGDGLPTGAAADQLNGGLPTGGLPTGGLPTGAAADRLPTGGLPTGAAADQLPTGGLPTGGLPAGGLPDKEAGAPPTGLPPAELPAAGGQSAVPSAAQLQPNSTSPPAPPAPPPAPLAPPPPAPPAPPPPPPPPAPPASPAPPAPPAPPPPPAGAPSGQPLPGVGDVASVAP